jgi:hypothetical protein
MVWQYDIRDRYRELRDRLMAETSAFLNRCLADPTLAVRIPRIKVGEGAFPPGLVERFWADVLGNGVIE